MAKKYDPKKIEGKWQKYWAKKKTYQTKKNKDRGTCYVLDMFPYPSGDGLHVGHPRGYIATDVYSRFKKMSGFNTLHPMGWDAFGLPAENYAIKNKVHPEIAVNKNIKRFKEQLSIIGFNYDWGREFSTTDPEYYRWTQWIFLQMYKKGLAFESYEPINWCPVDKTGLANEDVEDGKCERCGAVVEKRPMRQWVLRITDYADRLLNDLEILKDWPVSIKEAQKNWIGRSEGAEINFKVDNHAIKVFTTRPDTILGVTFIAVSSELAKTWIDIGWPASDEVKKYIKETLDQRLVGSFEEKDKTGISAGFGAINPATNEEVPVWIVNYVLGDVGTGAIMGVPAHDERDKQFAEKYNLPIADKPFIPVDEAIKKYGVSKVNYKLRDWVFSRQRYWGEPIPLIHCDKCGVVPVPEKDLPVKLPKVKNYEPTGTGESPLAAIDKWVNVKCPNCKCKAKRETNTMPQWAGSCWYYLRFIDPKNKKALIDKELEKNWMPVSLYVGGAEHATRHLIYARFWHKFLYDIGSVSTLEPFTRLHSVGLIAAEDGRKMSKRYGNVVNPDDVIDLYGADTFRLYEMFMGPFGQGIAWSTDNMVGCRRFLERVWAMQEFITKDESKEVTVALHKMIKKVGEDVESFSFNTAVSAMMIFGNVVHEKKSITKESYKSLLILLSVFAPHMAEEIWNTLGEKKSIYLAAWPSFDPELMQSETVVIAVQINGKTRAEIEVAPDTPDEEVKSAALSAQKVQDYVAGKGVKRVIVVKNRLINIVLD